MKNVFDTLTIDTAPKRSTSGDCDITLTMRIRIDKVLKRVRLFYIADENPFAFSHTSLVLCISEVKNGDFVNCFNRF